MSFKIGDKVCFSPDIFEKSKSELIEQYGTGVISSEEYTDAHLRPLPHPHLRPLPLSHLYHRFINIKWECIEEECWEYVDCLCLVEEREKRDIYQLFEQEMNY